MNVGKTSLKIRLKGSVDEISNKKAYIQVNNNIDEMTHGVDISTWRNDKKGALFSIWDFAGHEEYHVILFLFFLF